MDDAALAVSGAAFSAFCIWLTVRIVARRERWALWTAVWLAESVAILGSAYCTIFYAWLTATPLTPQELRAAQRYAYASMTVFAVTSVVAVITLVIFLRSQKSNGHDNQSSKPRD